jgi:hypothetical protein
LQTYLNKIDAILLQPLLVDEMFLVEVEGTPNIVVIFLLFLLLHSKSLSCSPLNTTMIVEQQSITNKKCPQVKSF